MARPRTSTTELARLLNSASQPIYVVDDDWTIVFCNQACLEWLGQTEDALLGRRCRYHSVAEVTGADAVAAGLCPPPAALAGNESTATVASPAGPRRARFVPVGSSRDKPIALVAIVDPVDLPAPETHPSVTEQSTAAELHEHIRRLRRQVAAHYRADRLLGDSPVVRRVRCQVELAAGSRASVLVFGPPGSGRQHVAQAIHYGADPESAGSLIPLACSVLGADLIHSTLGALAARNTTDGLEGRSTLLLSDADQLPGEVQAELAAVLSGKSFPLRLISTARRPLGEMARRGEFREDLACALSSIVIELPPLAQRRQDLPLLAQLFLEEANARSTKQVGGFLPEALDRLDAYPWPGNVDELAQIVAEAHQRAEGREIGLRDLPPRIHLAADAMAHPRRKEETIVLDEFLGRIERELIRRALARAKGNKAKAARLLGMTRPRLYRRLLQLGLDEGVP